jgi:hypothetical protein
LEPKWTSAQAVDRGSDARNRRVCGVSLYRGDWI